MTRPPVLARHPRSPILTRGDVPDVSPRVGDVSSVFNPGAVKLGDRYLLLLRVQTRGRETVLMLADGTDGVSFAVHPRLVELEGFSSIDPPPIHVFDPRITRIGEDLYVLASADTRDGCHVLVARLDVKPDYRLRLVSYTGERQARNGVLFGERVAGRFLRLERPNATRLPSGTLTGDEIWLAESDDLVTWRPVGAVLAGRPGYWDELIGSGPPPVKTRQGWLHVYHGVATHLGGAIYQAGVCLLDLADPGKLLARGRNNILEPREPYEMVGQVPNVVFPTGIIVERIDDDGFARPDSPVRLYYGAADTCVGLAETTIDRLLDACRVE